MEQQINPYEAGQAIQQGYVDPSSSMPVTPVALGALIGTKFWVSLVGIVLLVIVAINILTHLFMSTQVLSGSAQVALVIPFIMFVVQVVLAIRLIQYGKAIGRLKSGGTSQDFEQAMIVQTKFWKLFGIICIVMISLMLLTWIVMFMSFSAAF